MTVELPNVRKLFIPDEGHVVFDADLSGADAQVVAWEADDEDLKKAFRSGIKIHAKNAEDVFGDEYAKAPGDRQNKGTPKGKLYDQCKRSVHLTNYCGSARTMHLTPEIAWPMQKCYWFQNKWFSLHPRIKQWHQRVESDIRLTRTVSNKFGYRIVYFDRIDSLLPQALAWIPQSTVALITFKGAIQLRLTKEFRRPGFEHYTDEELLDRWRREPLLRFTYLGMKLQVHDSLVFQLPKTLAAETKLIRQRLSVSVPYRDPLTIPWGLARSETSWGECESVDD